MCIQITDETTYMPARARYKKEILKLIISPYFYPYKTYL
jgi:hypothetical protein